MSLIVIEVLKNICANIFYTKILNDNLKNSNTHARQYASIFFTQIKLCMNTFKVIQASNNCIVYFFYERDSIFHH